MNGIKQLILVLPCLLYGFQVESLGIEDINKGMQLQITMRCEEDVMTPLAGDMIYEWWKSIPLNYGMNYRENKATIDRSLVEKVLREHIKEKGLKMFREWWFQCPIFHVVKPSTLIKEASDNSIVPNGEGPSNTDITPVQNLEPSGLKKSSSNVGSPGEMKKFVRRSTLYRVDMDGISRPVGQFTEAGFSPKPRSNIDQAPGYQEYGSDNYQEGSYPATAPGYSAPPQEYPYPSYERTPSRRRIVRRVRYD